MDRKLEIRLPELTRAFELFRTGSDTDPVVTVHGDGALHIFLGNKHWFIAPNKTMRIVETETVWVVYSSHGESEGATIYAICSSEDLAEKARTKLAARLTVPLKDFETAEIAFNAGHMYGVLDQEGSFDLKTS